MISRWCRPPAPVGFDDAEPVVQPVSSPARSNLKLVFLRAAAAKPCDHCRLTKRTDKMNQAASQPGHPGPEQGPATVTESNPAVDGWPASFVNDLVAACDVVVGAKTDRSTLLTLEQLVRATVAKHRRLGTLTNLSKVTRRDPASGVGWRLLVTDFGAAMPIAVTLRGDMIEIGLAD